MSTPIQSFEVRQITIHPVHSHPTIMTRVRGHWKDSSQQLLQGDTRESPLRIMVGRRWLPLFIAAKALHYIKLPISRDVWTHRPFHSSYSALATALQTRAPPHATPSALALLGYISQCLDICWGSAQWVGLSSWALGNREIAQTVSGAVIKTSSRSLH